MFPDRLFSLQLAPGQLYWTAGKIAGLTRRPSRSWEFIEILEYACRQTVLADPRWPPRCAPSFLPGLSPLAQPLGRTTIEPILRSISRMAVCAQRNYLAAVGASGGFVGGRVGQHFEVVLIRALIHVHFGLERVAALRAILPIARMCFVEVVAAEREAAVIPTTTVPGVGEHHVFVLAIANPIPAALRLGQVFRLSTQAAMWNVFRARLLAAGALGSLATLLFWHRPTSFPV